MYRQSLRSIGSSVSVCTLLIALNAGTAFADSLPQPARAAFDQKVVARVSAEQALEHIWFLSEAIGPRISGLESEWEGAEYIASRLERYGYAVEMQPFSVPDQFVGTVELPSGERWQMVPAQEGRITGDEVVAGELIHVPGGALVGDFPPETPGKVVLMQAIGNNVYRRQVRYAAGAGAAAVILFNPILSPGDYGGAWRPSIGPKDIPVLAATWNQGEWLLEMLAQGPLTVSVQTRRYESLESVNVIGTRPSSSGAPDAGAVLVTAHLDSVAGAPGANDNASGVALALELARVLRDYNTDRELRIALFGSEERGLLGSRHYVAQMSDAELDRIVGVFNADMVATSDAESYQLYAMTVDGSSNLVSDAGAAAGTRLGNSSVLPARLGRSDHVSFDEVGIPAALFTRGRGGQFLAENYYHTPQDTLAENISLERMQSALDIVAAAVFDLIRKPVPALEVSRVRAEP